MKTLKNPYAGPNYIRRFWVGVFILWLAVMALVVASGIGTASACAYPSGCTPPSTTRPPVSARPAPVHDRPDAFAVTGADVRDILLAGLFLSVLGAALIWYEHTEPDE